MLHRGKYRGGGGGRRRIILNCKSKVWRLGEDVAYAMLMVEHVASYYNEQE